MPPGKGMPKKVLIKVAVAPKSQESRALSPPTVVLVPSAQPLPQPLPVQSAAQPAMLAPTPIVRSLSSVDMNAPPISGMTRSFSVGDEIDLDADLGDPDLGDLGDLGLLMSPPTRRAYRGVMVLNRSAAAEVRSFSFSFFNLFFAASNQELLEAAARYSPHCARALRSDHSPAVAEL
jgi:hypothetical protein